MKLSRIFATVTVTAALLAGAAPRASAFELSLTDVLGQPVRIAAATRAPTIIFFMSKSAKEASAAFAKAIDERLVDKPIDSIGIVDVRRYSGILRGVCTRYLKRSAEESKVKRRERRQARGVDATPTAVDRWHLVGDFDGSLFARFGVEAEPKQPLAFVVDCTGTLRGPFRDVEPVVAAATSPSANSAGR